MRSCWVPALGLALACLGAGCGRAGGDLQGLETPALGLGAVPPAKQRDLYLRLCSSCHGREGRGDGPLADQLRVPPSDLTRLSAAHGGEFPRTLVEDALTGRRDVPAHGPVDMPVWAERLAPIDSPAVAAVGLDQARELTALVDYVQSLQQPR